MLTELYNWFTEGFETADLQELWRCSTPGHCEPTSTMPTRAFTVEIHYDVRSMRDGLELSANLFMPVPREVDENSPLS
ncbi:MAG: hypothetical protein U0401_21270 [Anaerolineae bacterium]